MVDGSGVVVVLSQELGHGQTTSLSDQRHVESQFRSIEQDSVGVEPIGSGGSRSRKIGNLDHVGSIGLISAFSGVSGGVGVAAGPLEVDVISRSDREIIGDKVVLGRGIGLDDVTSLSSDVEIEDSVGGRDSGGSRSDVEDVRSVLESSSELRGIDSKGVVAILIGDGGVLSDGGIRCVHVPIDKSRGRAVSGGTQIGGGNVVSDSQSAVAVIGSNARESSSNGHGPVVLVGVTTVTSVTQKVISGKRGLDAIGSSMSVGGYLSPLKRGGAIGLIVGGRLNSVAHADESGLNVVGFGLVEVTVCHGSSQDGNIDPWSRGPVRVVVSLLGTFVSESVSVVVLSSVSGGVSSQVSIIDPESLVSQSSDAGLAI